MGPRLTDRRLTVWSVALAVLGVLLSWTLERGLQPVQAAPVSAATTAARLPMTSAPGEPRESYTPPPVPTPSPSPAAPKATAKPKPSPKPTASGFRLRVPGIGLDHRMYGGGLSSDGTIDPEPGSIMWFTGFERVRPGRVGTAVIAGHVASGSRRDVFANLADVDVGDKVQIVDKGKIITYRVTRASAINKYEVTTDSTVWGSNTSRSRLAIITCDDAFGFRGDGHRVANFVVIADRV
jgi:LPXTG-site transpeptidase (sortase) family protein